MADGAPRADEDPNAGPVGEDGEVPDPTTVWRAGHERVATGPLRAQADDVYIPEDEPLQGVTDRPARDRRTTRGIPAPDAAGLSSAPEGAATTGSADRSDGTQPRRGRNPAGRVEPERHT
jgi:hypothetical protein